MKNCFFLPALLLLAMGRVSAQVPVQSVEEVYNIFKARCISCHSNATPAGSLDLEGTGSTNLQKATSVYQKLYNKAPVNAHAKARGDKLIYPGRPDRSFLFRKINQNFEPSIAALHSSEGQAMPGYPNAGPPEPVEKETVRQWILYGAKPSGVIFNKTLVESWYAAGAAALKSFPDGPPPAPAASEGFQIKMGPFYLAPDGEVEYYQKWETALPAALEVSRTDIKISTSSHHFLIYNFGSASAAGAAPHGLRLNANHSDIGLVAAVQAQTDLRLPQGTAFKWPANFVLDLNSHYINYSLDRPLQCEAYINVYTQPVGTAAHEMFATLLVNQNIPISNNGNTITHAAAEFYPGADSLYIWGLMGHTHKYGTGYKVWQRLPGGAKGDILYDAACPQGTPGCPSPNYDFQHIPMRYWLPLLPLKWGNGLVHEATWVNEGPSPVNFGPTSNDEMMVLIVFYTEQPIFVGTGEPGAAWQNTVQVYPNPASGEIWFATAGNKNAERLRIFDLAGREVLRREGIGQGTFRVDIGRLPTGGYFFNLDGATGRFVVE